MVTNFPQSGISSNVFYRQQQPVTASDSSDSRKNRPIFNLPLNTHQHGNCPDGLCEADIQQQSRKKAIKGLLGVAALFTAGMLLHLLPPRLPEDGLKTILPADWKVWARVILGIAAVQKLNKTLDWKPPPWLGALESVAIINPLAVGFTLANLKQTAVMAPVVALVVQGASALNNKISKPVEDRWNIPPVMTRISLSVGLGILAILVYPKLYKMIVSTGIAGQELKRNALTAESSFASATFATCMRGCSPGSFICLSEAADIVGSFSNWYQSHKLNLTSTSNQATQPDLQRPPLTKRATL